MTNSEGDDRGAVYAEEGVTVYRASSLNRCVRCLVGLRLGFEGQAPPEKLQAVFARGHRVEDEVVAYLREQGWEITGQQDVVELEVGSFLPIYVRGHIDGRTEIPPDEEKQQPVLLEIKSCADASWIPWTTQRWEGKVDWELQTSVYQHATQLPMLIIAARVVEQKWTGELDFYLQELPRIPLAEIENLVAGIEEQVATGMLPEFCDKKDYGCPLWYMCSHAEDSTPPDTAPDIDELATALDHARTLKKPYEELEKTLRRQIDDALGDKDGVKTEGWSVQRVTSARASLDKEKVKEAGIDLSPYERTTLSSSIRVTRRKDRGSVDASNESSRTPDSGEAPLHGQGREREDQRVDVDSGPVPADRGDAEVLRDGDGSQPGGGAVPLDDTLPPDEHRASAVLGLRQPVLSDGDVAGTSDE